ncbi:MAG: MdtA/MuxA family multidrug efflux RND transporter periplasmic adaptor subunit [Bryobacteraceae bacterium]
MINSETPNPPPSMEPPPTAGPPVRRGGEPAKSHWWIWLLVFAGVGVGVYLLLPRITHGQTKTTAKSGRSKGAGGTIPVVGAKVRSGNLGIYLTGLGTVTAFNTVTVRSRVDGELIRVYYTEGQYVKQGDLLAEIDPRPFQVQLELAQGQMARDQAQLNNARVDLERYKVLFSQDSIPQQQLATQQATVQQDEGVIKADQAAIDSAKLQLTYCHITAPLTGRIGLRLVDQGNIVHAADTTGLVVITQLQPIAVIFNISEDSLPQVRKAMRGAHSLPVEAWDRDLKTRLARGSLLTIDNQIDQSTGTVRFKGEFSNEDNALFPNQFVNARLLVDTLRNAVIAPMAAVQRGPDGSYMYAVKPNNTAEVRNVGIGPIEGDEAEITSGVSPGDVVVIDGVDKLQAGSKVSVHLASAAAAVAAPTPADRVAGRPGAIRKISVPKGRQ